MNIDKRMHALLGILLMFTTCRSFNEGADSVVSGNTDEIRCSIH